MFIYIYIFIILYVYIYLLIYIFVYLYFFYCFYTSLHSLRKSCEEAAKAWCGTRFGKMAWRHSSAQLFYNWTGAPRRRDDPFSRRRDNGVIIQSQGRYNFIGSLMFHIYIYTYIYIFIHTYTYIYIYSCTII